MQFLRLRRLGLFLFALALPIVPSRAIAQTPSTDTANLKQITAEGLKKLTDAQLIALTGLKTGSQVGRGDMQEAADRLVATGLFGNVKYDFKTRAGDVYITFHLQENPRIPVFFDNIPWYGDSELNAAIQQKLPFYDGTLPEAGGVVDTAADAVKELLAAKKLEVTLEHQVVADPLGDGNAQQFAIEGAALITSKIDFSDAQLAENRAVQQYVSEIRGKAYSRTTVNVFLAEHVRPIYLKQGYLRVKLGPPEVRLTGDPNEQFPLQVPVYVPVELGPVYHMGPVAWAGNNAISTMTLDGMAGVKAGAPADGVALEGLWDAIREAYGERGYLQAKVDPVPTYDDKANTISYQVNLQEGPQYKMGGFVLTGISQNGEQRIHFSFPVSEGQVFDKAKYEQYLIKLQSHRDEIFGELPVHYDTVGHWLRTDDKKQTVDVLLDFK